MRSRQDQSPRRASFLGYMLLAVKRPADALAAFEITLTKEPNRYLALAGAVQAARETGDKARGKYTVALLALTAKADVPGRPEIAALKAELKKGRDNNESIDGGFEFWRLFSAASSSRLRRLARRRPIRCSGSARARSSRRRPGSSSPTTTASSAS